MAAVNINNASHEAMVLLKYAQHRNIRYDLEKSFSFNKTVKITGTVLRFSVNTS